ncbi:MAG: radical SAM protein [Acidobacteria bacterium]|nr:radical SAM protein [Acidobacteriota bacterium]
MNYTYTKTEFVEFYQQIGIEIGRLCNARCEHCITYSGPKNKEKMEPTMLRRILKEAGSLGLPHVEITGGEPFLFLDELEEIIALAKSYGMRTGITTNSSWATKHERAVKILMRLKAAGLVRLRFSIDQYHLNYIPLERVETAVKAAAEVGIYPLIEAAVGRKDYRAYEAVHRLKALAVELKMCELLPFGRAAEFAPETFFSGSFYQVAHTPCPTAGVPVVENDGRVLLCCTYPVAQDPNDMESPFVLGSTKEESLADILARHLYNPLLRVLRYEGPGGLLRVLEEGYGKKQYKPRELYPGSICTLCADMMDHVNLRKLWHETVAQHDMTAWFTPPVDMEHRPVEQVRMANAQSKSRSLPIVTLSCGDSHPHQ